MWANYICRPRPENFNLFETTMKTFLIVGAAGSGKTWVMKQLIEKLKLTVTGRVGMFLFHRNDKYCVLGKYDDTTFEGSDKLSMAVMRDLPKFQKVMKGYTVFCEGDRFTNSTFIQGVRPLILKIANDGAEGRKKRESNQTERQIKSIATRVSNVKGEKWQAMDSKEALRILLSEIV